MADNPWAAAASGATANPWQKASDPQKKRNPWATATGAGPNILGAIDNNARGADGRPFLSGAVETVAKGARGAMDLAQRPGLATQSVLAGDEPKDILDALLHGKSPEAQDRDRASILDPTAPFEHRQPVNPIDAAAARLPGGWPQTVTRTVGNALVDTALDPTTFVGGPAIKGAGTVARAGGGVLRKVVPERFGRYADAARDAMTFGGSAKRVLGDEAYHGALAAENRQAAREERVTQILNDRHDAIFSKLSEPEKRTVYQVLNGEAQLTDPVSGRFVHPPQVVQAAQDARKLLNDAAYLQADSAARKRLAYGIPTATNEPYVEPWNYRTSSMNDVIGERVNGAKPARSFQVLREKPRPYDLPPELREFLAPPDQAVLGRDNLRRNYLPGPKPEPVEGAPAAAPKPFNLLRPFSGNTLERDEIEVGDGDVSRFDQAFKDALRNAARQTTAGRMRAELGMPGSVSSSLTPQQQAIESLFERTPRPTGDARTLPQELLHDWKSIVNIPKNTVTTIGLKHGLVNVPTLAALSEGLPAAAEGIGRGAMIARMSPAARYEALRQGIEGGVIAPFADRDNAIVNTLERIPKVGKYLGGVSRGANALTWAIDDAAKQAVYRRKVARGMTPNQAAGETLREMIDYRHPSVATQALSNVAPFATFRSRLPAAVGSSLARNPYKALLADRLTGGSSSTGQGDGFELSTPLSDVVRGASDPKTYVRGTLADPIKAGITAATDAIMGDRANSRSRYFTYGQPVLPHVGKDGKIKAGFAASQLAGDVPGGIGDLILGGLGSNEFPAVDPLDVILGSGLGLHLR